MDEFAGTVCGMMDIYRIKFNAVVADINKRYAHLRQDSSTSSETLTEEVADERNDDYDNIEDEYLQNDGYIDNNGKQEETLSEVYVQNKESDESDNTLQDEEYEDCVNDDVERDNITNEVEKSEDETQSEDEKWNYVRFVLQLKVLFHWLSFCSVYTWQVLDSFFVFYKRRQSFVWY